MPEGATTKRQLWVRVAALIVLAIALWLAISVSFANIARRGNPDLVLRLRPDDAMAQTIKADRLLSPDASRARLDEAERLARGAIARDPTNARSFRVLAFITTLRGQDRRAEPQFRYAAELSRRDLPTQLWLIDHYVAENNAEGALDHFGTALTTAPESGEVLFPILVKASSDENLVAPLASFLRQPRPWRDALLAKIAIEGPSGRTVDRLFRRLERSGLELEPTVAAALINRLVNERAFQAALHHYSAATGGRPPSLIRNGSFNAPPKFAPLDWELLDTGDAGAYVVPRAGDPSEGQLEFTSSAGGSATLARQLVVAPAGDYVLRSRGRLYDAGSDAAPLWSIRCDQATRPLARLPTLEAGEDWQVQAVRLSIPATGCPALWLSLDLPDRRVGATVSGAIDRVELVPSGR